jgi:hypothetical protein
VDIDGPNILSLVQLQMLKRVLEESSVIVEHRFYSNQRKGGSLREECCRRGFERDVRAVAIPCT